jgi:predicted HAD superfamily phosphohydrolase
MALTKRQKEEIKNFLKEKLEEKLARYKSETTYMPFLVRLIQDTEKVAAYSFIQSVATTLGMSIYEEVSRIIAQPSAEECKTKYDLNSTLSPEQKEVIEEIIRQLRNGERKVNKEKEIEEVLRTPWKNGKPQKEGRIVDFYMKRNGIEYLFEIKTVKPNIDVFTASKKKLLEWIARLRRKAETILAFPYNPYHPQSYTRFTEQGLLEHGKELLVGKEYWDFLGGENTYEELLEIFYQVGKFYKEKILEKIKEVARTRFKD